MDDGTLIRLAVTIDRGTRSAVFDFEGTVSWSVSPVLIRLLEIATVSYDDCTTVILGSYTEGRIIP